MKRTISILFLLSLVLPLVGTYAFLELQKHQVKREVKWKMIEGVDKEDLVLLTFDKDDIETILDWKHSKEFSYQEEMYDIVQSEDKGDSISYFCWWDNKETELNKQLANVLQDFIGNKPINKKNKEHLISFYSKLYCPVQEPIKVFLHENKDRVCTAELALPIRYYSPDSPPPQLFFFYI